MKTFKFNSLTRALVAIAFTAIGSSAFAVSWNLDGSCPPEGGLVPNTVHNCGSNVTVSGFSTGTGTIASPTTGTIFAAAAVYNWTGGLGVVATNENQATTGPHATDNVNGTDALLIKFDTATSLTAVTLGWNGSDNPTGAYIDSDISVLAWTGIGDPAAGSITGSTAAGLVSAGWTLVGDYANVGTLAGDTQAISTSITSSYWLVSAYDAKWSGCTTGCLTGANDAFKLVSVAGNQTTKVPEPGSLALLGAGLLGWVASRKRKVAAI